MSDSAIKAEKLAAARRKLKEHQTSKKTKSPQEKNVVEHQQVNLNTTSNSQESLNQTTFTDEQSLNQTYSTNTDILPSQTPFDQQLLASSQDQPQATSTFHYQTSPFDSNNTNGPSLSQYFNNGTAFDGNNFSQQLQQPGVVVADPFDSLSTIASNQNELEPQQQLAPVVELPIAQQENTTNQYSKTFTNNLDVFQQSSQQQFQQEPAIIEQLRNEIENLRHQNSILTSNAGQVVPDLQAKLNSHIQTVNVLVEEKSNLTNCLQKLEHQVLEKTTEADELKNHLQASRHHVQRLETEVASVRQTRERYDETHQAINSELTKYQGEIKELRRVYEESQDDLAELKQKFNLKTVDYGNLQAELEKTRSDLHLAQLKVQQLTSADEPATNFTNMEQIVQNNLIKDQHIEELKKQIDQINMERTLNDQKYQNYVISLNQERASLAEQIQQLTVDNQKGSQREESLVKHISELEKQIQQQIQRQQQVESKNQQEEEVKGEAVGAGVVVSSAEEVGMLREQVTMVTAQLANVKQQLTESQIHQQNLQIQLQVKHDQLANQEMTIERLQVDRPDTINLMSEIESQKVTASRAVAQNQQLKDQLEEMQRAFVQMSNDKLELTDKLQTEQHLCREMKTVFNQMETELGMLRERFNLKDEEMIRMSHENTELEKQIFQNNQELDRLRHYEAHGEAGNILQLELQKLQEDNRNLQLRVDELEAKAMHDIVVAADGGGDHDHHDHKHDHHDHKHDHDHELHKENELLRLEKEELLKVINDFRNRIPHSNQNGMDDMVSNGQDALDDTRSETASTATPSIATSEAMEKLQQRFKRTIQEVADLTEEKYRLEHLVQRLQSETETIGEYITLYQTQRRLLKQKDLERDTQLKSLAADRELMKNRLIELNGLIERLITSKSKGATTLNGDENKENLDALSSQALNSANNNVQEGAADVKKTAKALTSYFSESQQVIHQNKALDVETKETADKILALLSDIKTANSNTFHTFSGVKHCSCCSGKLQTV